MKDEDEFSDAITKRLWNIAFTSKLNVKPCDDVGESQVSLCVYVSCSFYLKMLLKFSIFPICCLFYLYNNKQVVPGIYKPSLDEGNKKMTVEVRV